MPKTKRTFQDKQNYRLLLKPACESCASERQRQIHHLDGDPSNNDPANVQTLCASCHTRWHWQHGKPATPKSRVGPCSVCGAPVQKAGMCQKHYQRLRKYGDALLTKRRHGYGGPYSLVRLSMPD